MNAVHNSLAAAVRAPVLTHRKLAAAALSIARFITRTGKSRGEAVFWIVGAAIAAFGAAIVIASKLGDLAGLITLRRWRSGADFLEIGIALVVIYLVGHLFVGLVRAIRQEARWVRRGGDRP